MKKNLFSKNLAFMILTGLASGVLTFVAKADLPGDPDPTSPPFTRMGEQELVYGAASPSGIQYTFKLQNKNFDLSIQQKFPPGVHLDDAINAYSSLTLANHVSDFVEKVERVALPNDVARLQSSDAFYLYTTGVVRTPFRDFHKVARSICADSRTLNSWTRQCTVDTTHSTTRSVFYSGSNTTVCTEAKNALTCSLRFLGNPKDVNLVIVSRNAEQLSIAGSVQTLRDTGSIFTFLSAGHRAASNLHVIDVASEEESGANAINTYRSTALGQYTENMRFGDDYELAEGGDLTGKTLVESFSELTGQKSRTVY